MQKKRPAHEDFKALRARRLRAGRMFERGWSQAEVARELDVSRQNVSKWYWRWEDGGLEALGTVGKKGPKRFITEKQMEKVEKALLKGPAANGFPNDRWSLQRVRDLIEKLTGVSYSRGHALKILKKMGWSFQRPAGRATKRGGKATAQWRRKR
jgi:transposase